MTECYLVDLKFSDHEEILNFNLFKARYESQVKPLVGLAKSQGFESNWRYESVA